MFAIDSIADVDRGLLPLLISGEVAVCGNVRFLGGDPAFDPMSDIGPILDTSISALRDAIGRGRSLYLSPKPESYGWLTVIYSTLHCV
jgi:hypothetical protein